MSLEIYWKKALEQTQLSIDDESLYPLKTDIITRDLYEKDDFIIRKLDTSKFIKKKKFMVLSKIRFVLGKRY
jgi:ATP adenylyltransferase